jgi:hypothetical protein
MKKLLPFVLVLFVFGNAQGEEQKLSQAYEQQVVERVKAVFSLEAPEEVKRPICATPIFLEINFNRHRFSAKTAELLRAYVSRPDFEGEPEYVYDTPSGHFKIHYARTGADAVFQPDVDDNPQDGVPDYVNRCADIFDSVWTREAGEMKYNPPPPDDWYQPNGGDGKYDVYLKNINLKYLGYTEPETSSAANPISYTSYIVVRNDYSPYVAHEDKLDNLRVTAAHEFFHAVHMGYDASEFEFDNPDDPSTYKPYWMEMSAVWMEDMVFDGVNDYLGYLGSFFRHPDWSLKTFSYFNTVPDSALHAYGGCVFPMFLQERYDTSIIKDIWDECAKVSGNNAIDYSGGASAADKVLQARGSTFEEAFREFTLWNYFSGDRARTQVYYSEGDLFPQVKMDSLFHYHTTYPVYASSGPDNPHSLSSNYVVFVPDTELEPGGIRIEFIGHTGDYSVSVVGYKSYPLTPFVTSLIGVAEIYNWHSYTEVVMIPAVVTRSPDEGWLYEYHALYDSSLHGDEVLPEEDEVLQNYPNPFVIETESDKTFFPFVLSLPSRVRVDVFTLSGERIRTIVPRYDIRLGREEYVDHLVLRELDMFWDGKNEDQEYVSSGVYLYRFRTDRTTVVKKMAVIR